MAPAPPSPPEGAPDLTNGSETVQETKPEDEAGRAAVTVTMGEGLAPKDTKSGAQEPPASSEEEDVKLGGTGEEEDQNDDGAAPAVNATMSEDIQAKDNQPEVEEPPSSQVVGSVPPAAADDRSPSNQTPESAAAAAPAAPAPAAAAAAAAAVSEGLTATDSKPGEQEPPASSTEVVESKPPAPAAEAMPAPETPLETPPDSTLPPLNSKVDVGR
ncbi:hypothetical protein OJAV_G00094610 [Oryzias javanicus]|uniref:Uncharacterized protein n=1 Tax=Oryzias javanicus TaxID=123683 RepID=A0A437D195_ORYJA|nr:hypothetical protein OJAV_G00094610 [Oryzias javanicus]